MTKTATTTTMILVNEAEMGTRRFFTVEVGDAVSYFVEYTGVVKDKIGDFVLKSVTQRVTKEEGNALFFAFRRAGYHKVGTPATPEVPEPEKVAAPKEPKRAAKKAEPKAPKTQKKGHWDWSGVEGGFQYDKYLAKAEELGYGYKFRRGGKDMFHVYKDKRNATYVAMGAKYIED